MTGSDPGASAEGGGRYEIRLGGLLSDRWGAWFDGASLTRHEDGSTVLTCSVPDQAALHGLLHRVRDVGLPLLSVALVPAAPNTPGNAGPTDRGARP